MNKVWLIGNLTKNPELRYTPNGTAVCTFTLAVDNYKKEADFINIVVWEKRAETVAEYCTKGKQVSVCGRIATRNYENNDGQRIYVTEVVADDVKFMNAKNETADIKESQRDDLPFNL